MLTLLLILLLASQFCQVASQCNPIEVVWALDLSGSFSDDLPNQRVIIPQVCTAIATHNTAKCGIASFIDQPGLGGSTGDWAYKTELALSTSVVDVTKTLNGLSTRSGADLPESQLWALQQIALRQSEIGFSDADTEGVARVIVLITDADYHAAGAFSSNTPPPATNDGDDIVEAGEDYPSEKQVKDALEALDILPVFLSTEDALSDYQSFVTYLDRGSVYEIDSKSSDVLAAISDALYDRCGYDIVGGEPPPQDCVLSAWLAWSECSVFCGGGTQTRERIIITEAAHGGADCTGPYEETRACNAVPCPSCGDNITDADGNVYGTMIIGTQCWMTSNLKSVTKSGSAGGTISGRQCGTGQGPYGSYNLDCVNGAFYTWDAAMDSYTNFYPRPDHPLVRGICPQGAAGAMEWHVPAYEEWNTLKGFLGNFPSKTLQKVGNNCKGVACYRLGEVGFNAQLLGYITQYDNLTLGEPGPNYFASFWSSSRRHTFQEKQKVTRIDDNIHVYKLEYDDHRVVWETHPQEDYLSLRCVSNDITQNT